MIYVEKRPLPRNCIPSMDNGQLKTMTGIEGISIRNFSIAKLKDESRYVLAKCWNMLADLNSAGPERGRILPAGYDKRHYISFHYFIGRQGETWELISPPVRSYGNGPSSFKGRDYCNNYMVTIALIGDGIDDYEDCQYESLARLINEFSASYNNITSESVVRHSQIAIPSGKSKEPGSSFDMEKMLGYLEAYGYQETYLEQALS